MTPPGLLIVLSAPSGAGKGRVRAALQERIPEIQYGVSVTTRAARPGEIDGIHYHFVDRETFFQWVERGELVEWAEVYGHYYGTPRQPMETLLARDAQVLVEKDVQGALTLMKIYPDAVYVFILPPSLEELRRRVVHRGTETAEAIRQRLRSASEELTAVEHYDYVLVNDDIDRAADDLAAIIRAESMRVERYVKRNRRFWLKELQSRNAGGET